MQPHKANASGSDGVGVSLRLKAHKVLGETGGRIGRNVFEKLNVTIVFPRRLWSFCLVQEKSLISNRLNIRAAAGSNGLQTRERASKACHCGGSAATDNTARETRSVAEGRRLRLRPVV